VRCGVVRRGGGGAAECPGCVENCEDVAERKAKVPKVFFCEGGDKAHGDLPCCELSDTASTTRTRSWKKVGACLPSPKSSSHVVTASSS